MNRFLDFLLGIPFVYLLDFFQSKDKGAQGVVNKLLIVKLAAVGDTILLIPVLRELRKKLPQAEIHWLVSGINAALAETVPYVDKLHVWNPVSLKTFPTLVRRLKAERFDAILDLEQWARMTAILSYFAGAPVRVGFDTPGQHRAGLYTVSVPKSYDQHEIRDFFKAASVIADVSVDPTLELFETDQGRIEASQWAKNMVPAGGGPLVLLHPGCGTDGAPREWPLSEYALLGNWLINTYKARLILTGGPEEVKKTKRLSRLLNHQALDLGGRLSWQGTISLVKRVDAVVSGNTGIMHMAAALQKHQIALHGPTDPRIWGPLNHKAVVLQSSCPLCPCLRLGFEYHTKDQTCMRKIDLSEVKKAFSSFLRPERAERVEGFDNPDRIL